MRSAVFDLLRLASTRLGARLATDVFAIVVAAAVVIGIGVDPATASNGATLSRDLQRTVDTPRWLYVATGGIAVGASALLASFVTDRDVVHQVHRLSISTRISGRRYPRYLVWGFRTVALGAVVLAIYVGYTGPELPAASFTVLLAFVGVRAGLPILAYLLGNVWPLINPWRAVEALPNGRCDYPESLCRWPAVAGLLTLVWVELVLPVGTVPSVLATAIVGYSLVTLLGAVVFGADSWFENVDPLSIVFRLFGAVAPLQWREGAIELTLPGSELAETDVVSDGSDVAFVIALVWELTFSGFVSTTVGAAAVETAVEVLPGALGVGIRALIVYTALLLVGYLVFLGAYRHAATSSRRRTGTYLTERTIALRFAPSLVAIAAGYHLAHYATLAVSLSPAFLASVTSPLSPPANPLVLATPPWFEAVGIASVLIGHLLAVWTTHAAAYDLFASRPVALRSQYPFVAVMIGYTIVSLWILSLPGATPPYLP